ncbi:anaerobic ribonucleoside-triphosphate reductase activating protein [Patescibacteria group bacterium]|nr:anaerobic ribonucleoside-triphosphate reductase activating protein [Patescibacteria group bacterium]MBU4162340.1 anaerobic ribonucleoside-triphosphate reductase activating protein [Patescibacteria group bacterium]
MKIGGIQKSTLIDYPGKVSATIFVSGCNFKCGFCHNPELVLVEEIKKHQCISEEKIWEFLEERKGFLDGVVICGGEPTIYDDLPDFIEKIQDMGFLIKLDTNGSRPEILQQMIELNLLDYVAMDVKAPKKRYKAVVGADIDVGQIEKSIKLLKKGVIDFEFRTTLVPGLVERKDVLEIVKWISPAPKYFLQNFQSQGKIIDSKLSKVRPFQDGYLEKLKEEITPHFDVCQIR